MLARLTRSRRALPPAPRRRAAVLPGVLLAAVSTAFAGLAVLPAAAEVPAPRSAVAVPPAAAAPATPSAAAAPPAAERQVNVALGTALATGLAVALAPPPAERASRSRTAPEAAPAAPPAYARPGTGRLTSQFGRRWGRLHAGIDLAAGTGAPILAAANGTVQSAGSEGGYGQAVRILHGDGTVTVYAHLSRLQVGAGERVAAGQQIGLEGSTGRSTGPHLHFEVRVGGAPVDPLAWLRARGVAV